MLADLTASFIINVLYLIFFKSPRRQKLSRIFYGKQKLSFLIQPDGIRLHRAVSFQISRRRTAILPIKSPIESGMCLKAIFQSHIQNVPSFSNFINGPAQPAAIHILSQRHPHSLGKQMIVMAERKSRKGAQLLRSNLRFQIVLDIIQCQLDMDKSFFHPESTAFLSSFWETVGKSAAIPQPTVYCPACFLNQCGIRRSPYLIKLPQIRLRSLYHVTISKTFPELRLSCNWLLRIWLIRFLKNNRIGIENIIDYKP